MDIPTLSKKEEYSLSLSKNVKHFFHGNTKELKVLYFFGGSDA